MTRAAIPTRLAVLLSGTLALFACGGEDPRRFDFDFRERPDNWTRLRRYVPPLIPPRLLADRAKCSRSQVARRIPTQVR